MQQRGWNVLGLPAKCCPALNELTWCETLARTAGISVYLFVLLKKRKRGSSTKGYSVPSSAKPNRLARRPIRLAAVGPHGNIQGDLRLFFGGGGIVQV